LINHSTSKPDQAKAKPTTQSISEATMEPSRSNRTFDEIRKKPLIRKNVVVMVCVFVFCILSLVYSNSYTPGPASQKNKMNEDDPKFGFRGITKATLCSKKSEDQLKGLKMSQSEEDVKLLGYFNGLCGGSYIEMGALNGVLFSNSHVFNKAFGWKGLLVELSPSNYKELVENRRDEIAVVHAAVCTNHQTVHYAAGDNQAVGGIWEFASPAFRNQWWKGVTLDTLPAIECSPLQDIISKHVSKEAYFDFFSLDIEGAELVALESIDFTKVGFGIILVEVDKHNQLKNMALRTYLEDRGYKFLQEYQRSTWFYNARFGEIYKGLLHEQYNTL
jgi:hypothetical protein